MKKKYVEMKIPVDIISKVERVKKRAHGCADITFSDYLNRVILNGIGVEEQEIEEIKKSYRATRREQRRNNRIITLSDYV
jgi:hypothetical protein